MTYPVSEIDGTMVTGMMTPSTDREFTHPPELRDEIESRIPNYEISLDYPEYADRLDDFEVAVDDVLAKRRELMRIQMDRASDDWQLFFSSTPHPTDSSTSSGTWIGSSPTTRNSTTYSARS